MVKLIDLTLDALPGPWGCVDEIFIGKDKEKDLFVFFEMPFCSRSLVVKVPLVSEKESFTIILQHNSTRKLYNVVITTLVGKHFSSTS